MSSMAPPPCCPTCCNLESHKPCSRFGWHHLQTHKILWESRRWHQTVLGTRGIMTPIRNQALTRSFLCADDPLPICLRTFPHYTWLWKYLLWWYSVNKKYWASPAWAQVLETMLILVLCSLCTRICYSQVHSTFRKQKLMTQGICKHIFTFCHVPPHEQTHTRKKIAESSVMHFYSNAAFL